jgi:hypothetical protein
MVLNISIEIFWFQTKETFHQITKETFHQIKLEISQNSI